ncbi:MAG TPA: hypothetical protein VEJ18_18400 [Planctomycetota bacterium]|nr:hypothetical protein [Planctomycetota bacterium]
MGDLPQGVDPDIFEDLHTALEGVGLCYVLKRPAELWELVQLLRTDRSMVRGEVYRFDGLREAYRGAGIATTIVKKLDGIRERTGPMIKAFRAFLRGVPGAPADPETLEFLIAFVTLSPKGRDAVAKWVADPEGQKPDAAVKVKAISGIIDSYMKSLREWKPSPPPPSSPLDKENRPQLSPRFQKVETPLTGPLIPTGPPVFQPAAAKPAAAPAPAATAPPPPAAPAATAPTVPTAPAAAASPSPPSAPKAPAADAVSPVSLILPRGVNPEILEEVRRVDQCRKIFEETHQEIEVWEVFCLIMAEGEENRQTLERLLRLKESGDRGAFVDGALQLFDRLLKVRAQYGKFVKDLRAYLGTLAVGTFGKETMEMALGFIVASGRGRERAQLWLNEPGRYRSEACGRLEDVISRTMNYQTALRMMMTESP